MINHCQGSMIRSGVGMWGAEPPTMTILHTAPATLQAHTRQPRISVMYYVWGLGLGLD